MPGKEGGARTKSCASPTNGGTARSHPTRNGGKPRHPKTVADCKGAGLDGGAPAQEMSQWGHWWGSSLTPTMRSLRPAVSDVVAV